MAVDIEDMGREDDDILESDLPENSGILTGKETWQQLHKLLLEIEAYLQSGCRVRYGFDDIYRVDPWLLMAGSTPLAESIPLHPTQETINQIRADFRVWRDVGVALR